MKSSIKNFIKGIIVIGSFAIALIIANRVLMLKSEDGYDQIRSFYKQKDNTVDVIFIGSSRVYCDIDTGVLWDDFGIAAFDLGGAEAPTWNSYYYMKEALKTQTPKVIVYDASMIGYRHELLNQTETWVITNGFGMNFNRNRIDLIKLNCVNDNQFNNLIIPLNIMHSRYNDLTKNDFIDENDSINYKGFDYRDTVSPYERPDLDLLTEEAPVYDKHIEYLKKMFALSKENNIPFVVIIAPAVVPENEAMIFNTVKRICEEENITYIDFNKKYDELGINFETDMADYSHLNFSGSKKYCDYLGNYLKANYDIPDRRDDNKYASWEKDALINRQNRLKYDINNTLNEDDIYELTENNPVYITFKMSDGTVSVMNSGNVLLEKVSEGELKSGDVRLLFDVHDGYGDLYVNGKRYDIDDGDFLIYDAVLGEVVNEQSD